MGQIADADSQSGGRPIPRRLLYSIAYHASESDDYPRWRLARQNALEMFPVDAFADVSLRSALRERPPGVTWSLVSPDGVHQAVRVRDFSDLKTARRDARDLESSAESLQTVLVGDGDGRLAWWLALHDEVVLVAAYLAAPTSAPRRASAARTALIKLGQRQR